MASTFKTAVKPVTPSDPVAPRKSNAQRQADYRARHLVDDDGQLRRLNGLIDFHAKYALERLAFCYGVTQQAVLELLILQAECAAVQQANKASCHGNRDYCDKKIHLPWPGVTQ